MSTPENPPPAGGDEPGRGLSGVQRAGIVLGALAVLLIVFVVLQGGDDSGSDAAPSPATGTASQTTASTAAQSTASTSTGDTTETGDDSGSETGSTSTSASTSAPAVPASQTVNVVNGQPQGGVKTITFKKGDQAVLKVNSDTADEIHVHGYDLKKDVEKGGSVTFTFKATIDGRFEVELEDAGTQIANLEVTP
jgi:cytoskeletal protein RodZ